MQDLIKKIKGLYRPCTDMIKIEAKDIQQEKIDDAYNLALTNILLLFEDIECDHDWFHIKDDIKGDWDVCKNCKSWKKL